MRREAKAVHVNVSVVRTLVLFEAMGLVEIRGSRAVRAVREVRERQSPGHSVWRLFEKVPLAKEPEEETLLT